MLKLLVSFAEAVKAKFSLPGSAWPEDQLKSPLEDFLTNVGADYGIKVATKTEANLDDLQVRPDMAVYSDGLICGHVELKQPGLGADAPRLKGKNNRKQWEKLKALPNLIYTDGREWALYRNGERVGHLIRLTDDPSVVGKQAVQGDDDARLEPLLKDFLHWTPIVPHRPTELAKYLAPLTRFLRAEVEAALLVDGSDVSLLASEWRKYFFPDADDFQFADAYAQTVTYAMLLARLLGADKLNPVDAAKVLDQGNNLLARALELLGQPSAREELRVGFELLQRSLEALDPSKFLKSKPELWLYFYEDFLAAYDPKLRNDYGAYYTPLDVVEFQIRLTTQRLEKDFGKKLGFADDGVVFLDPAVGTGTYLVAAVKNGLERVLARSGAGSVPERAAQMAENMLGFELLVGPYAVAHLRLTQSLEGALQSVSGHHVILPERLKIYLADTLESPNATPPGGLTLTYKALTQEHEAARSVKNSGQILVCIGNPPYDRQTIDEGDEVSQRKGGWVRFGDRGQAKIDLKTGDIEGGQAKERPIFADFVEPATTAGAGVHVKNLYNDYVYFWRWALWRMFERQQTGGIVSFITASSYLAGPGFVGMREVMRKTFDALWIVDLGGDNLGTRKTPNVFAIQTPVCIALGVRKGGPNPDKPADVKYAKIEGISREEKLNKLSKVSSLGDLSWRDCSTDWLGTFLPVGQGTYFDWPSINDIFPWRHTGSQFKRSWPISEDKDVLEARWLALAQAPIADRTRLFSEASDKKIAFKPKDDRLPLNKIAAGSAAPR
jgi:hypothetical protein